MAAVAAVLAALGAVLLVRARTEVLAQGRLRSQIQAQLLAEHAAGVFRQAELGLRNVLPLLRAGDAVTPETAHRLRQETLFLPGVGNACVLGPDGALRHAVRPDMVPAFDARPFVEVHGGQGVGSRIGSVDPDRTAPGWFTVSLRIDGEDGSFRGVLLAFLDTGYFTSRFQEYRTVDVDLVALYDPEGRVLASWTDVAGDGTGVSGLRLLAGIPADFLQGGGVRTAATREAVVSVYQLPEFALRVVLAYDKGALLASWRRLAGAVGLGLGLLVLTLSVSALRLRAGTERRIRAEAALAGSRAREDLLHVFRRVALLAEDTEDLRDFVRQALREACAFLGWPGAVLHMPSGPLSSGAPLSLQGGTDIEALRTAASFLEGAEPAAVPPFPAPVRVPGLDADAVLFSAGEEGSTPGRFLFLTGGRDAEPLFDLLEQLAGLIYRTTVHRLETLERRRLQGELQHARQLEGLATLAGGVAHDVNNLMAGVLGNAELALEELGPAHPLAGGLKDIQEAARRGGELTEKMLATAGRVWMVAVPVDLVALLGALQPRLAARLPAGTRLDVAPPAEPLPVRADSRLLEDALGKLLENSAEAFAKRQGTVTVRAGRRAYDRAALAGFLFQAEIEVGPYAWIEVRDDGPGMTAETRENLFQPFFSTKFAGRGLGLSAVLGIMRQHRGSIRVESAVGTGTAVTLLLPCAEASELETGAAARSQP